MTQALDIPNSTVAGGIEGPGDGRAGAGAGGETERIGALDGLRGFAVLWVMLHHFVLMLVFVLLPLVHTFTPEQRVMAHRQVWLWTYTGNLAMVAYNAPIYDAGGLKLLHFWSLAIEEQFYLVWPAVVLLLSRKG